MTGLMRDWGPVFHKRAKVQNRISTFQGFWELRSSVTIVARARRASNYGTRTLKPVPSHQAQTRSRYADWLRRFTEPGNPSRACVVLVFVIAKPGFDFFDSQRLDPKRVGAQVMIWSESSVRGIGGLAHRYIDVFENLTRSDAEDSIAGFHQVVAFPATVLTAEVVGKSQAGIEFLRFH